MAMQQYGLPQKKESKPKFLWLYLIFLLILALSASIFMTQYIAYAYSYHSTLGTPIFKIFYSPLNWINWFKTIPDNYGIIQNALDYGQLIFIIPQFIVLSISFTFSRKPKAQINLHGSAKWATEEEICKTSLLDGEGVFVGAWEHNGVVNYLRHNGPEHILAFAPTRSGKGVGLVIPTLLSWQHSSITLDIKGENWALTAGYRSQYMKHKVLRFDPKDIDKSVRFNPISSIRLDSMYVVQDAQAIAAIIVDPNGKGINDYFEKAGFAFLIGAILHCVIITLHKHKRTATMCDLSIMLADPDLDTQELLEAMMTTDHVALLEECNIKARFAHELHSNIAASAKEMQNKADRELSGVLSTAGVNLSIYRDPTVSYVTSHSDFKVEDLMNYDVPVDLYIVISPADLDRLCPLTRLLFNVILSRLTEKMDFANGRSVQAYKHRLLLMLDEFTSLGNLSIFERSLAFMASYGLKTFIIVQDLSQLQKAYTKDEAIIANCHIRIAYAPNKPETAQILSNMTGKTTVVENKTSLSGSRSGHLKNASVSISETARPLLTPDECSRLPGMIKNSKGIVTKAGDMLIFVAGFSPIYGRQVLYFTDATLMARAMIPAPEKSHSLYEIQTTQEVESNASTPKENAYRKALADNAA